MSSATGKMSNLNDALFKCNRIYQVLKKLGIHYSMAFDSYHCHSHTGLVLGMKFSFSLPWPDYTVLLNQLCMIN